MDTVTPAAIKIIFDLLEKLISGKEKRRKDTFKEVIEPLYGQLLTIHEDYHQMFLNTVRALPRLVGEIWHIPGQSSFAEANVAVAVEKRIEQVKYDFKEWRKDKESIRDKVRYDAADFFNAVEGKEEKRFLMSIIQYFLEDNRSQDDDAFQDQLIKSVTLKGGNTALDTPSSRLDNKISEETDPAQLRVIFEDARNRLNDRFSFASARFNQLRILMQGLKKHKSVQSQ